ncbi:hypothetical protein FHS15_000630 [Paenibacillus castaneae]|uniref:DUF4184 family protein n=1 Tax=Paenibacillus castaneae TaxID=474957 RepID=UPI000C9B7A5E|nr:DUF4184 family protein [Paenibacillus castaneae]NIK75530.1 hypothetical protein [Paenibacillus castaneae]
MPFTLSHPLFAAPLKKVMPSLSITGLILGSMAPDIEYFIAMQPFRSNGHALEGLFLLALPTCIAFAIAFHYIIKPALPHMLPSFGGINRFAADSLRSWRLAAPLDWLFFLLSVCIGFYSHVFMDNWTHSGGWFVQRLPFLTTKVAGDEIYHILQLSLSVIGLAVPALYIVYCWFRWRKNGDKQQSRTVASSLDKPYWLLLVFFSCLFFIGKLILSGQYFSISIWAVAPLSAFLLSLYMVAMLYWTIQSQKITIGIWFVFVFFTVIAAYKLLTNQMSFSLPLWSAYIWILSTILVLSALVCKPCEKAAKE